MGPGWHAGSDNGNAARCFLRMSRAGFTLKILRHGRKEGACLQSCQLVLTVEEHLSANRVGGPRGAEPTSQTAWGHRGPLGAPWGGPVLGGLRRGSSLAAGAQSPGRAHRVAPLV